MSYSGRVHIERDLKDLTTQGARRSSIRIMPNEIIL